MDRPNTTSDFSNESTIVIGIPGNWKDIDELRHAIDRHSGGYSYSGMMLLHEDKKSSFGVELVDPTPKLREAYEAASFGHLPEDTLKAIEGHSMVVYLIGEGGSLDKAKALMPAVQAVLKAGGLAVKVESTGKAFSKEDWDALCAVEDATHLYDAFVLKLHAEGDVYYTCGMHNLGFRDAIVGAVDESTAAFALDVFSMYQILEQPHIRPGESFSAKEDLPSFQISEEKDVRFPPEDTLYNRHGLWILHPIVNA